MTDYSLAGTGQAIRSLILYSLSQNGHDQIFGEIRCVGDCHSADQSITVELEDEVIATLKEIFQRYDFDDYDSEEEELSKPIRCMVNFADQDGNLRAIFS